MCNHDSHDTFPISTGKVWHPDDKAQATPTRLNSSELYRPDVLNTIEAKIRELDGELRELSLDIHGMHISFAA